VAWYLTNQEWVDRLRARGLTTNRQGLTSAA